MGWRICMDYRKLNATTRKDSFSLSFINQVLNRLARKKYYYFLDGLEKVLKRCEETQLVLNWEKCHFMITKRFVLEYKISHVGLEVDPTKNDVSQPFELMCDVSDVEVGAMVGQRKDKVIHPINYTSKTLNEVQENYTTTEKELLMVVFAIEKYRSYIVGTKVMVTDHLSRLSNEPFQHEKKDIEDYFPNEQLFCVKERESWYANIVNYLLGPDNILRRCVPECETKEILTKCHNVPYEGHFGVQKTVAKVLQSRTRNTYHQNEMPQQPILEIELFDVWGIDFIGPFLQSSDHIYILLVVDYVSKMLHFRWSKLFVVKKIIPHSAVEIALLNGDNVFKVNG
ncbi:Transposon Ty3-I Gag-Pol polyprotein [Cucumis melo var. makuwa]|uniref:Transposon Ty3-I Gag-Pol polyprotein n=1 Tax=Cucumis melo var. makuwa TaxID=1194695 RepID=A0A5A7TFL9_CUCMM|nr:Transposon Ty3-I Gag-Pol polyprotein [Cucumis melo var. makuwa]